MKQITTGSLSPTLLEFSIMSKVQIVTTRACRKKVFESLLTEEIKGRFFLRSFPTGKVEVEFTHVSDLGDLLAVVKKLWGGKIIVCVLDRVKSLPGCTQVTLKEIVSDDEAVLRDVCKVCGQRAGLTGLRKVRTSLRKKLANVSAFLKTRK